MSRGALVQESKDLKLVHSGLQPLVPSKGDPMRLPLPL